MDASRPLAELEHAVQAGFQAFFVTGQAGAVLHRLLERLLQHCPRLKIMVTSRVRLGVAMEWLLPVAGMPCPEPEDQEYIHDKYMNELVVGKFLRETRSRLLGIVDKLRAARNIDAVILAGTELPLVLRDRVHNGVPILDTMRIHVEAAIAEMFS